MFKKSIINSQNIIIVFVWLIIFVNPILVESFSDKIHWDYIFHMWREFCFIVIVFFINRLIFVPNLFFKGRKILYFTSVFIVIILSLIFKLFLNTSNNKKGDIHIQHNPPPPPPPPHREMVYDDFKDINHREFMPDARRKAPIAPMGNLFLLMILILGFDLGLTFHSQLIESNEKKLMAQKEGIKDKMAFLQNQISPHFFMNTLNNIHALIDISPPLAQDAVIKLSNLMSYMLYEFQTDFISLNKELEFITSYVELMRIRFPDNVDIQINISKLIPKNVTIPPLLTISFIENAFKYGIDYEKKSFIHISIDTNDNMLWFHIKNSNYSNNNKTNSGSGIGIKNSINRLNLIYGNNYSLNISNKDSEIFEINMGILL